MKTRLLLPLVLLMAIVTLVSCKKDPATDFTISKTDVSNVSSQGDAISIEVTSGSDWTVYSNNLWCLPEAVRGSGNATVVLNVAANLEKTERSGVINIVSDGTTKSITITQKPSDGTEHHYKLPVIFHVIYADASNNKQNVTRGRMAEILAGVNAYYQDNVNSTDMNLEFVMAAKDPQGRTLDEPGVERKLWGGTYPISMNSVMNERNTEYKNILWDPNRYINVLVYFFASNESNVLGVAHLPFTPKSSYLDGTNESPTSYLTLDNLNFTYCMSLNSNYIYEQSTSTTYNMSDVIVTTAHELGHYLGLHHAFAQDNNGMLDECVDTDYCNDTPTYNRVAYERWFDQYMNQTTEPKFQDVVVRTGCDGAQFTSRNIMDYYVSYNDRFTLDQRSRIRYVLTYSPLIPGGKIRSNGTMLTKGVIEDLPIWTMQ